MADTRRAKAQRSLREASLTGALVDLSNADAREVAAECLVELLTTRPKAGVRRWVRVKGAEIVGTLDLAAATLVCALWLEECQFTAPISFAEAHAPAIRLLKCRLIALEAEQLHTRGSFVLDGSDATGGVSLPGAHIGGQLILAGATLTNHSGPALIGDGLQVDQDMFCNEGFDATGEVRLLGAHIGGVLDFTGARLTNECARALSADGLRVGWSMFCRGGFAATGLVSLIGAHVGGQLILAGATLKNVSGPALNAGGLRVDQRMMCNEGFSATGEVRLPGAHVGGQLNFAGAELTNGTGPALSAKRLQVDGGMLCDDGFAATGEVRLIAAQIGAELTFAGGTVDGGGVALALEDAKLRALRLQFAAAPPGEVDLRGARVERLIDRPQRGARCRLRGCRYDALDSDSSVSVTDRLGWLAADPDGYSPQPYEQLADVYRRSSDDEAARVLIAKQRRRRKEALRGLAKVWSWFLELTVGYGYRLWLAGVWLIVLAVVGSLLFGEVFDVVAKGSGDLTPAKDAHQVAPFRPVLYTVDVLLPLVSFGQDTSWNAHGAAQWVTATATVCGWLLATALLAGLVIRRE